RPAARPGHRPAQRPVVRPLRPDTAMVHRGQAPADDRRQDACGSEVRTRPHAGATVDGRAKARRTVRPGAPVNATDAGSAPSVTLMCGTQLEPPIPVAS